MNLRPRLLMNFHDFLLILEIDDPNNRLLIDCRQKIRSYEFSISAVLSIYY